MTPTVRSQHVPLPTDGDGEFRVELVDDVHSVAPQIVDHLGIVNQLADNGQVVSIRLVHGEIDRILHAKTGTEGLRDGDSHFVQSARRIAAVLTARTTGDPRGCRDRVLRASFLQNRVLRELREGISRVEAPWSSSKMIVDCSFSPEGSKEAAASGDVRKPWIVTSSG